MQKHLRIAGVFIIIIGIAVMINSYTELKLGDFHHPDSGFLPFWFGLALVFFSSLLVLQNLKTIDESVPFWKKGQWIKPLIAVLSVLVYGMIMELAGYLLSTLLFFLTWQAIIERERLVKTISISILGTIVMYLIFERWLGVPLPQGVLGL
ncbi:tripartite tricarboxylate transporter TctB family protein [Moorella sp. ACPs]|uniref:tripartite tricarboxylate transporter TctB family protein n=1 Tax=Neomoorella carbonis TaxID=3062783 RepID=UPI00324888DB